MITTWSRGDADYNMPEEILTRLNGMLRAHPWVRARCQLVIDLLGRRGLGIPASIMDAGCGTGANLLALEAAGYEVTGLDISLQALQKLDAPGRRLVEADLTKELPEDVPRFDVVLALDVIEHVDDDSAVVRQLVRLLKPGGAVLVSVPALPELYNEFDQVQGHRRRYTPDLLRQVFTGTGAEIVEVIWWGQWMVPILRRWKHRRRGLAGESSAEVYARYLALPPKPGQWLLSLMFRRDHRRALAGRNTAGTSLLAVARVPGGAVRSKG